MSLEDAAREIDRDYALRLSRLLWSFAEPDPPHRTIICEAQYFETACRILKATDAEAPEPVTIEEPPPGQPHPGTSAA